MIDIHNHLLINVDDGPTSKIEAQHLLEQAAGQGITNIMITPHHNVNFYYTPKATVFEEIKVLHEIIDENALDIKIHPGQEIRVNEHLLEELRDGISSTLNDTDYILIELPFGELPPFYETVIDELIINGYRPIIAHPERCRPVAENPEILRALIEKGAVAQVTAGSITGDFGPELQKIAMEMVENKLIHVVASDAHHAEERPFRMPEALEVIRKELGEKCAETLIDNAWKIFYNVPITHMVSARD